MKNNIVFGIILLFIFILTTQSRLIGQNNVVVIDDNYRCSCNIDSVDGLPVFTIAEKMPEYIGGDEARIKFLVENTVFPSYDETKDIQYSVFACFIIDTSGNVTNICIYKSKYSDHFTELEKNIMKVIAKMPQWKPGVKDGKKVAIRFNMPVKFDLDEK